MIRRRSRTLLLFAITVVMLACVPTLGPASAPIPTFDVNAPLTAIVQTAAVAGTQTAINAPPTATPTASPTRTPTITPTGTPTFVFFFFTSTVPPTLIPAGSSGREYQCQVLAVDPPENSTVSSTSIFNVRWTVANVGRGIWDANNMDYRYSDGERLYRQSVYDFPITVAPGDTVELIAEMQAPAESGTYTTTWTIATGNNWFCPMNATIVVQ